MKRGVGTFYSRNVMPMVSSLVINVLNINLVLSYFGYVLEPIENYHTNDEEESRSAKKKIKPSEDYSFNDDDCEFFSDDSLLSYVKSSTFKSQDWDKDENVTEDLSKDIIENNEEDVDQVKTISSNPGSATNNVSNIRNVSKGNKSTRGKGKRKGKKK